jgi:transposase-like protein
MARTYTDTERADAVAVYVEHGLAEAHRRTGIPKGTLQSWLTPEQRTQVSAHTASKTRAANEAHALDLEATRAELRAELANASLHHVRRSLEAEKGNDAQAWMVAGAIGVDKLLLVTGEATSRIEHVAAPERTPDQEAELDRTLRLVADRAA